MSSLRLEVAIVCALTLFAAIIRLWQLDTVPLGLHGDEAWTGIDARRVIDEGWIGPYLVSALGQPIGPVYWAALWLWFLPDTTLVLRLSMAFFGILTIPVAYLAFRVMFGRAPAAFGALLLAGMMWHLHLGRTAFMVQAWPLVEVSVLLFLFLAMKHRSLWLFALAGAIAGLGVYSYNSYLLFLPVPLVGIIWWLARHSSDGNRLGFAVIALSLFITTAAIAVASMVHYVHENTFEWRYHQRVVGVMYQEEWKQASLAGKAEIITDRAWEWQKGLILGDRPDLGDGLATTGHPPVEPVVYGLAIVGLLMALWRWREAEYAILIAAAFILPWGALLTVYDGLFRRTLGLAPFIAVLAALPLSWAWSRIVDNRPTGWAAYLAALVFVPAFAAVSTTYRYFVPVQDTFTMAFVYPYQVDAASRYIDGLPDGTLVYFYSDRWMFDYESRQFLAPGVQCVDRSFEFGPPVDSLDFGADRTRDTAFVFLGNYLSEAGRVRADFPEAIETTSSRGDEVLYHAFFIPRHE